MTDIIANAIAARKDDLEFVAGLFAELDGAETPFADEPPDYQEHCRVRARKLITRLSTLSPASDAGRDGVIEECAKIADEFSEEGRFSVSDTWRNDMTPTQVYQTAATDVGGWIAKDIRALSAAPAETPAREWRCFHCDETFTTAESALEHFGPHLLADPACQIDIKKYREMEDYNDRCRAEDSDSDRTFYAMQADHARALIVEEQKGYDKGLADGRAECAAIREALKEAKEFIEPKPWAKSTIAKLTAALALPSMKEG